MLVQNLFTNKGAHITYTKQGDANVPAAQEDQQRLLKAKLRPSKKASAVSVQGLKWKIDKSSQVSFVRRKVRELQSRQSIQLFVVLCGSTAVGNTILLDSEVLVLVLQENSRSTMFGL